jgi:biopolymer transport protein ExbD
MAFGSSGTFGGKKGSSFGGGEEVGAISLNMTALMDILSNLLFFLLASYAATNVEIKGSEGMQLPTSTSETEATLSILVRVTLDVIEVEGKPILRVKNGQPVGRHDGDKIVQLYDELVRVGIQGKKVKGKQVKMTDENTVLLVLADKRADYDLISKVLKTAGYAGYPNFRFAVLKR